MLDIEINGAKAMETPEKPANQPKRLYRSCHSKVLGGVAGGLAEYVGIDPVLMRLIFIVLILLPGISVLAYLIAWAIIPKDPNCQH